jgi:hypothetical protein
MKGEVQRLVDLDVLTNVIFSEWAAPSFGVPKPDSSIRFVTDFHLVNNHVVCHPYPTPPGTYVLRTQQGFTFITLLDVNMGFRTIPLAELSQKICTTILTMG